MAKKLSLDDIITRTEFREGDIECITSMHATLYKKEYDYGLQFELYVAAGLHEFAKQYEAKNNSIWVCEHNGNIIGSLLLVNRGDAAQLRYFILLPEYRNIGLGKKLMDLFIAYLHQCNYKSCYLWTTNEQEAAAHLYKKYGFELTEEKPSTAFGKPLIEQRYDLKI
ncbi:MAG: GNAT family N-acetyltransferase [Bacteroidia bacterium]